MSGVINPVSLAGLVIILTIIAAAVISHRRELYSEAQQNQAINMWLQTAKTVEPTTYIYPADHPSGQFPVARFIPDVPSRYDTYVRDALDARTVDECMAKMCERIGI